MRFIKLLCSLLLFAVQLNVIKSIDEAVYDTLGLAPTPVSTVLKIYLKWLDRNVLQKAEETVPQKLDKMMKDIHQELSTIGTKIENSALEIINHEIYSEARNDLKRLSTSIRYLNLWYYNRFLPCWNGSGCFNETKQAYIERYTSTSKDSIREELVQLPSIIAGVTIGNASQHLPSIFSDGLFDIMINANNHQIRLGKHCGSKRSQNQQIFDIYNAILETMMNSHLATYTALYEKYNHTLFTGNEKNIENFHIWNTEWSSILGEFKNLVFQINEIVLHALKRASREIFPCDPEVWEKRNYGEMKYFLNGYLAAERVLNDDGSCSGTCNDYSNVTYFPKEGYANELACKGRIYNCTYTNANSVTVTPNLEFERGRSLRYQFVGETYCYNSHHEVEKRYGKGYYEIINDYCEFGDTIFYSIELNPKHKHPFYECDMCHCICDNTDHAYTTRRFSHEMVTSITSEGFVITGIRFTETRNGYGLEIQQGRLVNGTIKADRLGWISPEFNPAKNPDDTLTYESRCMNLDNIEAPTGYVVTGVAFTKNGDCQALKIQATKMDNAGNLIPSETLDLVAPNIKNRKEIKLDAPDESNLAPTKSRVISKPSQNFIKFQVTDWNKDASQHVVPYLDKQFVTADSPIPLGGIGIHYKGTEGYGGFIGLSIFSPSLELALDKSKVIDTFNEFSNETLLKVN